MFKSIDWPNNFYLQQSIINHNNVSESLSAFDCLSVQKKLLTNKLDFAIVQQAVSLTIYVSTSPQLTDTIKGIHSMLIILGK